MVRSKDVFFRKEVPECEESVLKPSELGALEIRIKAISLRHQGRQERVYASSTPPPPPPPPTSSRSLFLFIAFFVLFDKTGATVFLVLVYLLLLHPHSETSFNST
ncbi:hypothetical protein JZ751_015135, partial [Albula glossodonta]